MFSSTWNTFLYEPLMNVLAFLISIIPGGDVGIAVIILTLIVKFLIFPLSQKAIKSQSEVALINPEVNKIKANTKTSKEEQARQIFDLYKKHKKNPFSGFFLILIQIPIIFALYFVFFDFFKEMKFDTNLLYSFIKNPEYINTVFLGIIDLGKKSLFLAVLAGFSQYLQAVYMPQPVSNGNPGSFQESFAKSMQMQMKYFFPVIMGFFAYQLSGVIALYFIISNIFAIGQQIYFNKHKDLSTLNYKTR
ncbi:MAG: YidC/Oxa1 family membrane protein insertase [Patescibacteria group bacterium]